MNLLRRQEHSFITNAAQYAGTYRGTQEGLMCWEVKDPEQEPFKDILEAVCLQISRCRSIPISTLLIIDIFLRGRTLETTTVYVMLAASSERQRKKAVKFLKRSSLLAEYPGLKIDHWNWPPQSPNITMTGDNGKAADTSFVFWCPEFEIRRLASHTMHDDRNIPDGSLFSIVANIEGHDVTRVGTLSCVVVVGPDKFLIAPAHIFIPCPPDEPDKDDSESNSNSSSGEPLRVESATPPDFDSDVSSSKASGSTIDEGLRGRISMANPNSPPESPTPLNTDPRYKSIGKSHEFKHQPSLHPRKLLSPSCSVSDYASPSELQTQGDASDWNEDEEGPITQSNNKAIDPDIASRIDNSEGKLDDEKPELERQKLRQMSESNTFNERANRKLRDSEFYDILDVIETVASANRLRRQRLPAGLLFLDPDFSDIKALKEPDSKEGGPPNTQYSNPLPSIQVISYDSPSAGNKASIKSISSEESRLESRNYRMFPTPETEGFGHYEIKQREFTSLPRTSPTFRIFSLEHDYALIAMRIGDPVYSNLHHMSKRTVHTIITGQIAVSTTTPSRGLIHGSLDGRPIRMRLPYSSKFSKLYPVSLSDPMSEGDCGSVVVAQDTKRTCGFIVAASEAAKLAYIVSADEIIEDISSRLGK